MNNLTDERMLAIYVLWTEFRLTVTEIGNLMNLPNSIIRATIKSVRYEVSMNDCSKEISEMKQLLLENEFKVINPVCGIIHKT